MRDEKAKVKRQNLRTNYQKYFASLSLCAFALINLFSK